MVPITLSISLLWTYFLLLLETRRWEEEVAIYSLRYDIWTDVNSHEKREKEKHVTLSKAKKGLFKMENQSQFPP